MGVSQLVVVPKKNGGVRVCIDPRELNKALLREHYTLPILEDTLHELGQSRMFTKADLSSGYWLLACATRSRIYYADDLPDMLWSLQIHSSTICDVCLIGNIPEETVGGTRRPARCRAHRR